jgi:hypothetical protein
VSGVCAICIVNGNREGIRNRDRNYVYSMACIPAMARSSRKHYLFDPGFESLLRGTHAGFITQNSQHKSIKCFHGKMYRGKEKKRHRRSFGDWLTSQPVLFSSQRPKVVASPHSSLYKSCPPSRLWQQLSSSYCPTPPLLFVSYLVCTSVPTVLRSPFPPSTKCITNYAELPVVSGIYAFCWLDCERYW